MARREYTKSEAAAALDWENRLHADERRHLHVLDIMAADVRDKRHAAELARVTAERDEDAETLDNMRRWLAEAKESAIKASARAEKAEAEVACVTADLLDFAEHVERCWYDHLSAPDDGKWVASRILAIATGENGDVAGDLDGEGVSDGE